MDTFTNEIDNIFNEKGLSSNMYQLYTNTKFVSDYDGFLILGDLTTREQIISKEKIFNSKSFHNIKILHDNFYITMIPGGILVMRINGHNTEILGVRSFLIFDDENWCYFTGNTIVKMFNDQQIGVVVVHTLDYPQVMKIGNLIGVCCARGEKIKLYNNEVNSEVVREYDFSFQRGLHYYNNDVFGFDKPSIDGTVRIEYFNLADSELYTKNIKVSLGYIRSDVFNDFILFRYNDCIVCINPFTDVEFNIKITDFECMTQCGDIVIIIQKDCITRVNLKTLEITNKKK